MAFAPYHNQDLTNGAGEQIRGRLLGQFREVDCGNCYEYAERFYGQYSGEFFGQSAAWQSDFDKIVFVGGQDTLTPETRLAKVLKTVVYIIVDELANGEPVVEKWQIKQHREYQ